ncbi:hypothetical protein [Chitiniphilus shinanonensis]|uniref:hypothetical protein n=1 Tax=Chitiniphilus shinanonensis TaxID=553088 RepID=UPI0033407042
MPINEGWMARFYSPSPRRVPHNVPGEAPILAAGMELLESRFFRKTTLEHTWPSSARTI